MHCLVTGVTGYIGGRLVPELLAAGHDVRCMTRRPARLRERPWAGEVEFAEADALDPDAVRDALAGTQVAYYLIHAIGGDRDFAATDRRAARVFAAAAKETEVGRIVYLGGLYSGGPLSAHLRSRGEVEELLLASGVPTAALRAGVIVGAGSTSFEMLRYLTERLPVMVTPRWVHSRIQPIAIRDVLHYLVGAATLPGDVSRAFDIGGPDVLTYREMMVRYAAVAGLPSRLIVPVPVLSPWLSSLWVGLVTPVPGPLARPLVESLTSEVVCREHDIAAHIPHPPGGPVGFDDAIRLALRRVREAEVAGRWSAAATAREPGDPLPGDPLPSDPLPTDPDWAGGSLFTDERRHRTAAPPAAVWRVVEGIGGDAGWYSLPVAWRLRGLLDRLAGGAGLRRGRRDPRHLRVGDAVDFWRVEALEPGRLLRLRAEMRLPGRAWLELTVRPGDDGGTEYAQRAIFHPHGLLGHLYWWAISPFHRLIFGRMPRNVARKAEEGTRPTLRQRARS
jgi:uncharacterized protein YbjT (DUF2867 family)